MYHMTCVHTGTAIKETHLYKHIPLATKVDGGIKDDRWFSLEQELSHKELDLLSFMNWVQWCVKRC